MSDELQSDQPVETGAEQQANTGTSDLATGEPGADQENKASEKVEFTPEQQTVFNKAIERQHAKFRDAERAQQETQAQLDKAQGRVSEFEANQPKPTIPPMPDAFDDEFEAKVVIRDAAIRADANFQQNQGYIAQAQQKAANDRVLAQQQQGVKNTQTLATNATRLDIKTDDLVQASATVGSYNLAPALVEHVMTHEDGPLMIVHLAANQAQLLGPLSELPLGQAFDMLSTTVLKGAQALKPKTSDAPPPPDVLSGNGAIETDDRPMIAGATFE